jgi:hypothetical protein
MKLKPCKRCGSNNVGVYPSNDGYFRYIATCDKCHWLGKAKLFKFRAIRAWNREVLR